MRGAYSARQRRFQASRRPNSLARRLVAQAAERGRVDHTWIGAAGLVVPDAGTTVPVTVSPVFSGDRVIEVLIAAPGDGGEALATDPPWSRARGKGRLVGVRADRLVLVSLQEIRFAEADGNRVWLTTDRGRLRARTRGLVHLAAALDSARFIRVHRRYVANLERVREIEPAFKGGMWLVMDAGPRREIVPVSRRREPELRRALGI
jgi:sigma-54 dependent transcriptional regulator, acetoin dehydrogenase operon transcriptional activator AcoR